MQFVLARTRLNVTEELAQTYKGREEETMKLRDKIEELRQGIEEAHKGMDELMAIIAKSDREIAAIRALRN